jgi:glycosyltransferase involved in cell wall biosynthesis
MKSTARTGRKAPTRKPARDAATGTAPATASTAPSPRAIHPGAVQDAGTFAGGSYPASGLVGAAPDAATTADAGPATGYTAVQFGAGAASGGALFAWRPVFRRAPDLPAMPPQPGRPLRVVHVGPCLTRGGAEQWLVELTRFLDPSRVRVLRTIATVPGAIDPSFTRDLPVPVETGGAAAVRRAAEEADVLLSWGVALDELLGDVRPKLSVFVAHGDGDYSRGLVERAKGHADHVIAVSERVRRHACDGLPSTVIYNGIDAARLATTLPRDEARAALGFGPDDFVVGYLGRFAPEKRVPLILEALEGLPEDVKALLVGWGPLLPELRERAGRLAPGRVAFVTAADYLGDYYQAMDAFTLLGTEEGFSLAKLEAMMCGVPLIVTPVGAVPELIVDRVNGLVVAPDAPALRGAITRLRQFPHWAAGLAAEAQSFARRHGHAARMARDYERVLLALWADRHGPLLAPAPKAKAKARATKPKAAAKPKPLTRATTKA